jgi:protein-disulfide isomerase
MCKRVVPELYRLVATDLKAQAKLYFRPFPIRTHEGSLEGGLAFLAAAQLKRFWPFVEKLFAEFDHFRANQLPGWAAQAGMDSEAFRRALGETKIRELLVASKKEGLRNGVSSTPAVFINGRRFQGSLDRDTLRDVLEEETDRVSGRAY